ncbi:uncharacterized protein LOC108740121 [Agrilus planipennis]|uniref:Uncharacterized protein LOC108740121 n=1 Tax=Agrilus planipennis TaxID=224129 RepID=A0A1W4XBM8_AGRPL|nr:uncharacterized protein LOC108740121 [Agrilus planipennis]
MIFNAGVVFTALLLILEYGEVRAAPAIENRDTHNIYECENPAKSKMLLFSHIVNEPAKFLQFIQKTVYYPETTSTNSKRISCLIVTDISTDGSSGFPSVVGGGVGSFFAELLIRSQFNKGLYYRVDIYGDVL